MNENMSSKEKEKVWNRILNHPDYESCDQDEECCSPHCHNKAVGDIYFWCGDPECCTPPSAFYCRKHLMQQYADLPDNL